MNEAARPLRVPGVFTQGSILRHVLVMAGTGAVGLFAIFFVDFLSLLYVSWLGDPELTAAVGISTQVMFFGISLGIGFSIAVGAIVSRALGEGDRQRARRLAGSVLAHTAFTNILLLAAALYFLDDILALFGATGRVADGARLFLLITLPANLFMTMGMTLSGVLRAAGDARRAMAVTLGGAIVVAIADPILIFGLGLGIHGAAISTALSRMIFLAVGVWGAMHVHDLVARPAWRTFWRNFWRDAGPTYNIAIPAILTNLATPVAMAYTVGVIARSGAEAVAGFAMTDRIVGVAYAAVFALSGAVGPILGQNLGARLPGRMHAVLNTSLFLTMVYTLVVWAGLALFAPQVAALFGATGQTADLVILFCHWGAGSWMLLSCLFVANAVFNNLGYPILSTVFNWGRTTLGTIPFVTWGAARGGPEGAMIGMFAGSAIFGLAALVGVYVVMRRLEKKILKG